MIPSSAQGTGKYFELLKVQTDWPRARLGNFPTVERSVLQSHHGRLGSWHPHTIMHILLSVHNHFCHLQTLHIHVVAPIALVGKLGKYLQSSFRWDKELEFQERCDGVAGDPALCRWAGTSGAPVGRKAWSALELGSPAVNVGKLNEAKTCRVLAPGLYLWQPRQANSPEQCPVRSSFSWWKASLSLGMATAIPRRNLGFNVALTVYRVCSFWHLWSSTGLKHYNYLFPL